MTHVGWLVFAFACGFALGVCCTEGSPGPAIGFILGVVAMLGVLAARGVAL